MNGHPHGEQLSAYADGMLDLAQMRAVARHLAQCYACRASLTSLQQTKARLRDMSAPQSPGPEFWANTFRRLRTEGSAPSERESVWDALKRGGQGTGRRWAAGMAAAAALGALVLLPQLMPVSPPPTAQSSPASEDTVDLSSLVRAHTDSAAREPLADPDRQTMISADTDELSAFADPTVETMGDGVGSAADTAH